MPAATAGPAAYTGRGAHKPQQSHTIHSKKRTKINKIITATTTGTTIAL